MRPKKIVLVIVFTFIVLTSLTSFSQQTYVNRFDVFGGYSYFSTPSLNLVQNGFNTEFGYNWKTWLALGFDFSVFNGDNAITPNMLTPALQTTLAQQIAFLQSVGQLPPGYQLRMPTSSTTYTYSAGPQINIRHFKPVTIFVRPALGSLHEVANLHPKDPFASQVALVLAGPSMQKSDTVTFYGVGGGLDFNITTHFGLRTAADYVHYSMFSNTLGSSQNTVRFSIGPTFRFGGNIVK
jgi:outer membrane protein with beta-barrel domain